MKKYIEEDLSLDGLTVDDAMILLEKYASKDSATICLGTSYDCATALIGYYREETGPEQSNRIKQEQRADRVQYEKYVELKAKFGDNIPPEPEPDVTIRTGKI